MAKILHVTDAFNGGVFEVILELIYRFPTHEYIVLFRTHSWDPKSDHTKFLTNGKVQLVEWEKSPWAKFWQLKSIIRSQKPQIVHLHSSLAGVLGRLLPGSKSFVIYSPHAFAFQKLDVSKFLRSFYLAIEVLLQRKTFANIAFWPIEREYFKKMRNSSKTIYAPVMIEKYKSISKSQFSDTNPNSKREKLNLVSIGRLAPQKDPGFFVEVVKELKGEIHFESCWYGDGTQFPKKILHENEIKLRGWQDQQVILEEIKSKRTVAVFSSRWESGPITLFEVLTSGVPVVCRSIEAFQTYGLGDGDSPKDLALQVLELNATQDLSKIATLQLENIWRSLPNSQTLMLERLYMGI